MFLIICHGFNLMYQEIETAFFSRITDIDDIRMHDSLLRLCFKSEFGHKIGIYTEFLFQYLDLPKRFRLKSLTLYTYDILPVPIFFSISYRPPITNPQS